MSLPDPESPGAIRVTDAQSRGIRVLHVDDDPDFLDLAATVLEQEDDDLEIRSATTPEAGLEILRETRIDCVVSDYQMPEQDGLSFLADVREAYPDLPFILCTGKGSEEIASDAISAGVTDYIRKRGGLDQFTLLSNRIQQAVASYRAERELAITREQHRTLVEQNLVGIYLIQDGMFKYVNPKLAETFGYEREALHGASPLSLVAPEDRDLVIRNLSRRERGEIHEVQYTVTGLTRDGERFEIELHGSRTEYRGEPAVLGAVLDVGKREGQPRNLTFFRQAVEQIGTGIAAYDEEGIIHYANEAYAAMLGTTVDDLLGSHITGVNPEFEKCRFDEYWASFDENETRTREAVNNRLDDGTEFPVDVVTTHVSVGDEEYHVGTIRDISGRKADERRLARQNERLAHFGETVAHDLRNPLSVIDGYLEVARRRDDPAAAHEKIGDAVDRMTVLIDQLLRLAQHGQTVLNPSPVSLDSIARSAWANVRTAEMTLTVEEDTTVPMDESRGRELFENLFRNSREHGGDDVAVTVGSLADGFYVADDGPGIPASERNQVLERGFTTADDGTGFGLSIVSQIAQSHDWTVTVTEGEAGGARIEFRGGEDEPGSADPPG